MHTTLHEFQKNTEREETGEKCGFTAKHRLLDLKSQKEKHSHMLEIQKQLKL